MRKTTLLNQTGVKKPTGYRQGFCTECGINFSYPASQRPRPSFCDIHDDSQPSSPINLDAYRGAIVSSSETETFTRMRKQLATVIENPAVIFQPPVDGGISFSNSPRVHSAEEIRQDYIRRLSHSQTPEISQIALPFSKTGTIGINHLGDVHIGTDACVYSAWKELLEWILHTEDEYLAIQGDMVDQLTGVSVGVMAEQSMTIQDQFTLVTDDLMPLAKARKILWMLRGNHEERMDKATKNIVDGAQTMARHLDVPYLAMEGYTKVHCEGTSYLSYNVHGFNAGRGAGSRRNKMATILGMFPSADVVTCGHNHHLDAIQTYEEIVEPSTNRRVQRSRWGLYTGTFHAYQGYAADTVLGPGALGFGRVEFVPSTGNLTARAMPIEWVDGKYRPRLP